MTEPNDKPAAPRHKTDCAFWGGRPFAQYICTCGADSAVSAEPPEARAAALIADVLLQEPLLHGNAEHRAWLTAEIRRRVPEISEIIRERLMVDETGFDEQTEARWQDAIYRKLQQLVPPVADSLDGSGCESGDALDVTLAEIEQSVLAATADLQRQLAECYRLTGPDPDGNEDWRLAPHAVEEVRRLRTDSDETEAEVERLREAHTPRWIPVGERLPKLGMGVICACKDGTVHFGHRGGVGGWFDITVTHWMPTPEHPQEGGK